MNFGLSDIRPKAILCSDYESSKISNTRSVLRGIYQGKSSGANCHELRMETSVALESYDGLSGSPVYHMKRKIRGREELMFPMLVGMLLRGTASSRIAHFVGSDVLANMLRGIYQGKSSRRELP